MALAIAQAMLLTTAKSQSLFYGAHMRKTCTGLAAAIGILSAVAAQAQTAPAPTPDAAARFGALEAVSDISLSPDGAHIAFIAPGTDGSADLYVVTTTEGATPQNILHSSGDPETLQ